MRFVNVEDVIERLLLLGLAHDEASVYVQMNILGACKASDVATSTKIARPRVYAILQTLVQRGFASASLSRPVRFEAAPPEKLFKDVMHAQEGQWERLMSSKEEIAGALNALRSRQNESLGPNTIKTLYGRDECLQMEESLVYNAKRSIFLAARMDNGHDAPGLDALLHLSLRRAVQGLDVRLVLDRAPEPRDQFESLLHQPTLAVRRSGSPGRLRMAVVDGLQVFLWVVHDPTTLRKSAKDVALWSDAPDFVAAQSAMADAYWSQAQPFELPARAVQRAK